MKKSRKVISILLTLILLVGLMPLQAMAITILEPDIHHSFLFYSTDPDTVEDESDTSRLEPRETSITTNDNVLASTSTTIKLFEALVLDEGEYYLNADHTSKVPIVIPKETKVGICLCGHTIDFSNTAQLPGIIVEDGATLSISDCYTSGYTNTLFEGTENEVTLNYGAIIGGKMSNVWVDTGGAFQLWGGAIAGGNGAGYGAGGVQVYKGGNFTMIDGLIYNNTATLSGGGGVDVWDEANFVFKLGTISGNKSEQGGGGVTLRKNDYGSATGGTMKMAGGTITGNSSGADAGGILVAQNSNLTLESGTIEKNTSASYGGGVAVKGNFTMNGGTISENTVVSDTPDSFLTGGGVRVTSTGTFTMNNGSIVKNVVDGTNNNAIARTIGGGVFNQGVFNLRGGEISGNKVTEGIMGGVANYKTSALNVSGNPKVKNNRADYNRTHNIVNYSSNTTFITVDGALTDGAELHVDYVDNSALLTTGDFAAGTESYTITDADSTKFHASTDLPGVVVRTGNTLSILKKATSSLEGSVTGADKNYNYSFTMNASGDVKGTFIICLYDSNNILIYRKPIEMTEAAATFTDTAAITTDTEAASYKIMFWNSIGSLMPMCEAAGGNITVNSGQ